MVNFHDRPYTVFSLCRLVLMQPSRLPQNPMKIIFSLYDTLCIWHGGVMVRVLDSQSSGRVFDSRPSTFM